MNSSLPQKLRIDICRYIPAGRAAILVWCRASATIWKMTLHLCACTVGSVRFPPNYRAKVPCAKNADCSAFG